MSEFSKELLVTAELCQARDIDVFAKHVPMDWVAEAVQHTGRSLLRTRRFPAEQVFWLVLGIGLMRNRTIQ
ncbi:MAG: transposase domain-containing protein [Shewanella sp.]|nr:transposase domain-containing protein [Shewanella sp.]MCF1437359.1 transposase domain-containing protein [Shewanella sp.]MCF1457237.1 transposase domain-containing protein [Shewanella sp.]